MMLILASQSRTRMSLLQNAGYVFDAIPARIDEREIEKQAKAENLDQSQLTAKLAAAKALDISKQNPKALVLGSDQTLAINGDYLHKSPNLPALHTQLEKLKGQTHYLCSAVALAKDNRVIWQHQSIAKMKMRCFSDAERDQIISLEGDKLFQSVGGYRLEGPSIRLFEKIEGDYFTILGLPMLETIAALAKFMD